MSNHVHDFKLYMSFFSDILNEVLSTHHTLKNQSLNGRIVAISPWEVSCIDVYDPQTGSVLVIHENYDISILSCNNTLF